jgi:hypothetical protein
VSLRLPCRFQFHDFEPRVSRVPDSHYAAAQQAGGDPTRVKNFMSLSA